MKQDYKLEKYGGTNYSTITNNKENERCNIYAPSSKCYIGWNKVREGTIKPELIVKIKIMYKKVSINLNDVSNNMSNIETRFKVPLRNIREHVNRFESKVGNEIVKVRIGFIEIMN